MSDNLNEVFTEEQANELRAKGVGGSTTFMEMVNVLKARFAVLDDGTCYECGKIGKTYRCGRCKKVRYCSKACQKKDWYPHGIFGASHKEICKVIIKNN